MRRTSKPVMSQYLLCGSTDGGASMDASATHINYASYGTINENQLTSGEVFFWDRIFWSLGLSINIHTLLFLLPLLPSPFPLVLLPLAFLGEDRLQILRPPVVVLCVAGILEGACIMQIRELLSKCLEKT